MRYLKSAMMVAAGFCWLMAAVGFGFFLFQYLAEGAGLQVFGFFGVSSLTVLVGLAHFIGFVAAAFLCFVIGVGLCAHGLVPAPRLEAKTLSLPKQRFAVLQHLVESWRTTKDSEMVLRCVSCRIPLAVPTDICPECGWAQPPYLRVERKLESDHPRAIW